jgi:hypothetical protein
MDELSRFADMEARGDYPALIEGVRALVAADRTVLSRPEVKTWTSRRWTNLFLTEAVADPQVVETARKHLILSKVPLPTPTKKGSPRAVVAQRFLKDVTAATWDDDLPPAQHMEISHTTLLLCPGLLTGLLHPGAHPFIDEAPALERERGWRTLRVDLHPFRSGRANEADLIAAMDRGEGFTADNVPVDEPTPPGKVVLLGYSKGGPDILQFLVDHPEYGDRVAAVVTWAGANGGSFTADTIYEQVKDLDLKAGTDRLHQVLASVNPLMSERVGLRRVDEYDVVGAFDDLRTTTREAFLAENSAVLEASGVPFFTVSGSTTPLEVPNFQFTDTVRMTSFDANNDMQLTQKQARLDLATATHLAMLHGHHWDIAYAPFPPRMRALSPNLDHPFPRKAALAATWLLLAELGLID